MPNQDEPLEEAKHQREKKLAGKITKQEIEMALAYLQGYVTLSEVGLYLSKTPRERVQPVMVAYRRLPKILRLASMRGLITFTKEKI